MNSEITPCPCGGVPLGAQYSKCCGRYHSGESQGYAPTPEALMRSRYSAYVMSLDEYIRATWHASTRPTSGRFGDVAKWLGLTVVGAPHTNGDEGYVRFVARYRPVGGGAAIRIEEHSRFVREGGRWLYVDAVSSSRD